MTFLTQHRTFYLQWLPAVLFVFLPFNLYLLMLDFFSPVGIEAANNSVKSALPMLINLTEETTLLQLIKLESSFIQYCGLLILHILISLVLFMYFLGLFLKRLNSLPRHATPLLL